MVVLTVEESLSKFEDLEKPIKDIAELGGIKFQTAIGIEMINNVEPLL